MSVVKSGIVAVSKPVNPESMRVSPQDTNVKGRAIFAIPSTAIIPISFEEVRSGIFRTITHTQTATAERVTRNVTSVIGPISAIAIFIQKYDVPQHKVPSVMKAAHCL
jgi:hypothetical protein